MQHNASHQNSPQVTGSSCSDDARLRGSAFNDLVFLGLGMEESAGASSAWAARKLNKIHAQTHYALPQVICIKSSYIIKKSLYQCK